MMLYQNAAAVVADALGEKFFLLLLEFLYVIRFLRKNYSSRIPTSRGEFHKTYIITPR